VASEAYREAITKAAGELGLAVEEAPLLSELPEFVDFFAHGTAAAITDLEPNQGAVIAFTAHSLPMEDLVDNDPYIEGLERVANKVATALGLDPGTQAAGEPIFGSFRAFGSATPPRPWFLAYQSKGQRPGAWLGPDLDDLIEAVAEAGAPAIIVCPLGFVTDHMETLYDLDIIAQDKALMLDLEFVRAPVPNDYEDLVCSMAQSIARAI
jgi:ferrochelatase